MLTSCSAFLGRSIILSIVLTQRFAASAQELSDTSGWALRGNLTCPSSESSCGGFVNGFAACCPASSPCLPQYNSVCCPPNTNCTNALVEAGPWCADPTWVLCNNGGYFCCLPGQKCFSDGDTDGCAYPGSELGPNMQVLESVQQVPRPASSSSSSPTTTTTSSSSSSTTSLASTSLASTTTTTAASIQTSNSTPSQQQSSQPQGNYGGLLTGDKIALGVGIGIGLPVGMATIIGAWISWKMYRRKTHKSSRKSGAWS